MRFQPLHDFHDHRYVLTTSRNAARQSQVRAELAGWDLEWFHGVDADDVLTGQAAR